jgi:hypothetical protein
MRKAFQSFEKEKKSLKKRKNSKTWEKKISFLRMRPLQQNSFVPQTRSQFYSVFHRFRQVKLA